MKLFKFLGNTGLVSANKVYNVAYAVVHILGLYCVYVQ
jgi:hypothetical protein